MSCSLLSVSIATHSTTIILRQCTPQYILMKSKIKWKLNQLAWAREIRENLKTTNANVTVRITTWQNAKNDDRRKWRSNWTDRHIQSRELCIRRHRHSRNYQVCSYTSSVPYTRRYLSHTRLRLQNILPSTSLGIRAVITPTESSTS